MSEELKKRLEKNIVKMYFSGAVGSTNFNLVVYTLFILSKGFGMREFFIFESAYALASLIAQIPTGTFADKFGRKNSIIISTLINIPAILMIILSRDFTIIFLAMFIGGIGSSFYNGAGTAMMYDTVKSLGREDEYKKIIGRGDLFYSVAAAVGAIIGGWLAHFNYAYAWWAYFATQLPMLITDFSLIEPSVHEEQKLSWRGHLKESIWQSFRGDAAYFIMYSAVITIFFALGYWLWQPYLKSINVPIIYFGFVYAVINVIGGIVSSQAHKIEKKIGMLTSLMLAPILLVVAFIFQSQQFVVWGVILVFVHSIISGYKGPVLDDYLNSRIPSAQRATVLSVEYMIHDGIFIVTSPLLGSLVDLYSLKTAYLLMAGILLIVTFIFWLTFKKQKISADSVLI